MIGGGVAEYMRCMGSHANAMLLSTQLNIEALEETDILLS